MGKRRGEGGESFGSGGVFAGVALMVVLGVAGCGVRGGDG